MAPGAEEFVTTVEIEPFDETESEQLAEAKPVIRPLLFGDERVREIARRPFFRGRPRAIIARRSIWTGRTAVGG